MTVRELRGGGDAEIAGTISGWWTSRAAVRLLEEQIGSEIGRDNLECGDGPIALDEDSSVLCAITDPTSGDVYDATLTVSDTTTGEFDIVVADEPR